MPTKPATRNNVPNSGKSNTEILGQFYIELGACTLGSITAFAAPRIYEKVPVEEHAAIEALYSYITNGNEVKLLKMLRHPSLKVRFVADKKAEVAGNTADIAADI